MNIINKLPLNGILKGWIYQNYLIPTLCWPMLVQDFALHHMDKITSIATQMLKTWFGIYKKADSGILWRPRSQCGLQLTSPLIHLQRMQIIKCHLLINSPDNHIHQLYIVKEKLEENLVREWRPSQVLTSVQSEVDFELRFKGQHHRLGLGNGLYNNAPTNALKRHLCVETVVNKNLEKLVNHSSTLVHQSTWMKWKDTTIPVDLSWKSLIFIRTPKLLSFFLNSCIDATQSVACYIFGVPMFLLL